MKKLLIAIFGLTVIDVGLTYWGYKAGHIEEANPLLSYVYRNSPEASSILILLFVGCLLGILWNYKEKARHMYVFVIGVLLVKIAVVGIHINWLLKI